MDLQSALDALSNHETFAVFILTIRDLREEAIAELHKADFEQIQQISGRILTYDIGKKIWVVCYNNFIAIA
jgi:hypothetical protein